MELIARISKGTKMDQVYIPKNRPGLTTGSYVIIKPIETKSQTKKLNLYNVKQIEPIKMDIASKIIEAIDQFTNQNIIISGSFLDKGFNFNDIDIIIINENKLDINQIQRIIEKELGIKTHIIQLDNKALINGLQTDPLYKMLLSKCIAKKRFIYKTKNKINYKILDLHLLKSKILIDNFDFLSGNEKYYLMRNLIAIALFLQNKEINKEKVDKEIIKTFDLESIDQIKQNLLEKNKFLKRYKTIYKQLFDKIMKNASK
ncbi:MAG: hypothetical protein AABW46_04620 [Nanoarchaeota archaeon]